jgi:pentatricopeptide repeat protein
LEAAIQQQRAAAAAAAKTETEIEIETEIEAATGTGSRTGAETGTLRPPPMALYLMLQIEIKAAAAQSTQRTMDLYEKFKGHVLDNRHRTFTQLAQDPTVWNAFLFAFCKQQQYASAAGVIKEMSSDTSNAPEPNIYSWNIFMQTFFKTGQVKAAERVFALARARGIEPDQYSYGVLSRGYAKAQLVDRIGIWVAELDETEELDPDLLRALASVTDRQGVMVELEKAREAKEAAAREAREKAKRDHQAWLFKLVHETHYPDSPAPSDPKVDTNLKKAEERGAEEKPASVASPGEITKSLPLFNAKKMFSLRSTAEAEAEVRPQGEKKENAGM